MDRPFVYMNMAASADGKITSAARDYPTFTSRTDRKNMDRLRAEADALLVGAGTVRADDPPLHVRDPEMQALRRSLGKPAGLCNVLVSASGVVSLESSFFCAHPTTGRIVATTERIVAEQRAAMGSRGDVEVWVLGRERVDLHHLLLRLRQRGIERLLLEGGGELNWDLVRAGLVDEIHLTIAPTLLGGRDAPTLLEGEGFRMDTRVPLELTSVCQRDHEIFCRYRVTHRPS